MKMDKPNISGRRRPHAILHRSLSDPINGANRKPNIGDKLHTIVMCYNIEVNRFDFL